MKSRASNKEPKSACDVVKELLEKPPYNHSYFPFTKSGSIDEGIKHQNDLDRAKTACELGMVVSPFSENKSRFFYYARREDYQAQKEAKEERLEMREVREF